jgi:tRNA1(Val) A37 N6-methylase TrmN6
MKTTKDAVLYGEIMLRQPVGGPRVSVDTVLLAAYAGIKKSERVLELGSAHGAVSLLLAKRYPDAAAIEGLEMQEDLVQLARMNAAENGFTGMPVFRMGDLRRIREIYPPQSFQVLVMNPPYGERENSRLSPDPREAAARHGLHCTLEDVAVAAKYVLANKGRFYLVMRASRLAETCAVLAGAGLQPKLVRPVYPKPGRDASVFLMKAVRAAGVGMLMEPPLFVEDEKGCFTDDLLKAYRIGESLCRW